MHDEHCYIFCVDLNKEKRLVRYLVLGYFVQMLVVACLIIYGMFMWGHGNRWHNKDFPKFLEMILLFIENESSLLLIFGPYEWGGGAKSLHHLYVK